MRINEKICAESEPGRTNSATRGGRLQEWAPRQFPTALDRISPWGRVTFRVASRGQTQAVVRVGKEADTV